MSSSLYVIVMMGVMILVTVVSVPALFFKKCPRCGVRNGIDAKKCRKCSEVFPE
jgi:ribosomal protein L40E